MSQSFPFLRLPLELRDQIYSHYFKPFDRVIPAEEGAYGVAQYRFDFDIYRVSKQIKTEAEDVFRRENVFVRIETPWPQAAHHVAQEGLFPIVAAGRSGSIFKHSTSIVSISAPLHDFTPKHTVIVLLDDLHHFCQVWFYSALNYRTLNEHLRVDFTLRDPYYPADPQEIPLSLQKRLLLSFGQVKGLYEVEVNGFDEAVKRELQTEMAKPYDSVQKCLEDSADFMASGDRALSAGDAQEALDLYVKAFKAMHIIISGRSRRVLADSFFHENIEAGPYYGRNGSTVRITLRIGLVCRVVAAYLKLDRSEEAAFWGMRSIKIMREAMDTEFEDFLTDFIKTNDVGLLYVRTGMAFKRMEENKSVELKEYKGDGVASSEKLWRLSTRYFRESYQGLVKQEIEGYGMKYDDEIFRKEVRENASDVDSLAPMDIQMLVEMVQAAGADLESLSTEAESSVWD